MSSEVPPTRMNQQIFKVKKKAAQSGHKLLKKKADALKVGAFRRHGPFPPSVCSTASINAMLLVASKTRKGLPIVTVKSISLTKMIRSASSLSSL